MYFIWGEDLMSLLDLAPDAITIGIKGQDYTMEYSYLSLRELEKIYGSEEAYGEVAMRFISDPTAVKSGDIVNFLYAGLLHSDFFRESNLIDKKIMPWRINREGCLEMIRGLLMPKETAKYMLIIIAAWTNSSISQEMAEILEVMAADSQKKTVIEANGTSDMPS